MKFSTKKMVEASFFLALGLILPMLFHQFGMLGQLLLPMHIPVLLCGFILGKRYGSLVGFITPFLSSVLTGMPPIYPTALAMALELAVYGYAAGYFFKKKNINIILSLVIAMILGRIVSGMANLILFSMAGKPYAFSMFITASFVKPVWGIILQLIAIPTIVTVLEKAKKGAAVNG